MMEVFDNKTHTLTDYIEKKQATDVEFSEHYIREETINNLAEMIVGARKKVHLTQYELADKIGTKTFFRKIEFNEPFD